MEDLLARVGRAIASLGKGPAERALDRVLAACAAEDAEAAALALSELPERERFVAAIVLGLARPNVARALAERVDATLPAKGAFDWSSFCSAELAAEWATALATVVPDATAAAVLGRTFYGRGALLVAARDRVKRGALDGARLFVRAMDPLAKRERGVALALIALAGDRVELGAALTAADGGPVIQSGGEEVEALAAVLAELTVLAPDDETVLACLTKLSGWREHQLEQRDQKSYGYAIATKACARAASPAQPRWLEHAERMRALVWASEDDLAPHLERARARVAGQDAPAPAEPAPKPAVVPELSAIAVEPRTEQRLESATRWMMVPGHDRLAALRVVVAPPSRVEERTERALSSELAAAHAAAGDAEAATAVLLRLVLAKTPLPASAWRAAESLEGERAARFVRAVIEAGLAPSQLDGRWDAAHAGPILARIAVASADPTLPLDALRAVAVVGTHEDHPTAEAARLRRRRVHASVQALAVALGAERLAERLETLRDVLGAGSPFLASAAIAFPAWPRERIASELGPIAPEATPALAVAWAGGGRMKDAIALLAELDPRPRAAGLRALADLVLAPADAKLLRAAFEKCPKASRDRDDQGLWKHQRLELRLRIGEVDETIAELAKMGDVRYSGAGPTHLALDVAHWLDAKKSWTAARAQALVSALGTSGAIAQDLPRAIFALVPSAARHAELEDLDVAALGRKLTDGDRAVLDLARAVAHADHGEKAAGEVLLRKALEGTGRRFFVGPAYFALTARHVGASDETWRAVLRTAASSQPRDAIEALVAGVAGIGLAEAHAVDRALAVLTSSEVVDHVRTELRAQLARAKDADADAAELFATAIERSPDARTARSGSRDARIARPRR